jgi:cytochrome c-type biogenesis protein CcmH/NrfG
MRSGLHGFYRNPFPLSGIMRGFTMDKEFERFARAGHRDRRVERLMIFKNLHNHVKRLFLFLSVATVMLSALDGAFAQGGAHTLFGDFKVEENVADNTKPIRYDLILYNEWGQVVTRQVVTNNGRYRFMDLADGLYDLVVEVENSEVARIRATVKSLQKSDFRQDILLGWRSNPGLDRDRKDKVVSIDAGVYQRTPGNRALFDRAADASQKQNYEKSVALLRQILNSDPKDFEAWTELGTALLSQKKDDDAEKAYLTGLEHQPTYVLALVNLGRLRLKRKNFEGAIENLREAVKAQPGSATANYYLGEAYLQIKKGSLGEIHLQAALKLDPIGKAEAHLRLAALYNAAGLKDRAVIEYEEFLKKKPDHPSKNKLQQYIVENKKP